MNLPEALVTGRAVLAVRGVLMACSIVPGRPDWVLGLTNPDKGRPDWVIGLELIGKKTTWGTSECIHYLHPQLQYNNFGFTEQPELDLHLDSFLGVSVMCQALCVKQHFITKV